MGNAGAGALREEKKKKKKGPLTAAMWSRTAPLLRSSLVKKSLGNSRIAEEREGGEKRHGHHGDAAVERGTRHRPSQRGPHDFTVGVSPEEWASGRHGYHQCIPTHSHLTQQKCLVYINMGYRSPSASNANLIAACEYLQKRKINSAASHSTRHHTHSWKKTDVRA